MPASFPTTAKTFTTKVNGAGNEIDAAHVNDLQNEVTAVEQWLLGTAFRFTDIAYVSSNFTADAGTWVVGSGDQVTYAYLLLDKVMVLSFSIATTTLTGTPTALIIAMPESKAPSKTLGVPILINNNGTLTFGQARVSVAGGGFVYCYTATGAAWANATNATSVEGTIIIPLT